MKRYAESKTSDEYGDMLDGVYESPFGDYVKLDELIEWLKERTEEFRRAGNGAHPKSCERVARYRCQEATDAVIKHIEE